jgi:glycosyltransferase involved in cell wall biosynthesis
MQETFVSTIIPTRNRPDLVSRAVRSALGQTHKQLEVIVIIDGPCPTTEMALAEIGDARLRVVALSKSIGGCDARNTGVQNARGDWIAFLDDDDEWLPEKIAKQLRVANLAAGEFPIIATEVTAKSPYGDFQWPRRFPDTDEPICEYLFNRKSLFRGEGQLQTSMLLTTRALMERVPFTSGLRRHQDSEWYLRVSQISGVEFHFVRESLVKWYIEEDRGAITNREDWESSLDWLRSNRSRMTRRAYAGFISTQLAPEASKQGEWGAVPTLFNEMVRYGDPGFMEIIIFAAMWSIPSSFRRSIRAFLHPKPAV